MVKSVSLDVREGEFVVFVGPSGCGKSTLLRMIAGLEHTTSGDIVIDGKRVNDLPPVKRGIAMVFQSYALYPHMTVFENIAFPLRVEKVGEEDVRRKVDKAARILHLDERLQQKPGMLSGGQRQRVAIGRAIVREPKIFLFDEPLSNLDAALRADMRIELTSLHKALGATMIYVTHDQIEAMTMADRIVVLNAGIIAQVGTPMQLYHEPENVFVAQFIGNPKMNLLPVTCVGAGPEGVTVELDGQRALIPVEPGAADAGPDAQARDPAGACPGRRGRAHADHHPHRHRAAGPADDRLRSGRGRVGHLLPGVARRDRGRRRPAAPDRDPGGGLPPLRPRGPGLPPAGRPLGLRRLIIPFRGPQR